MSLPDSEFLALQTALRGRYSIEQELGRGGMGIVYLAHDVQLQRPVAIKLLVPALAADSGMRSRFLREARLAAMCFHPNIVPIHSVEEFGELAWFVMAYVRGESLADRVRRTGVLSADNVRQMAQDIGWALAYAHERGVVHRDVKPENILIDAESERFLLADFGIALQNDAITQPLVQFDSELAPRASLREVSDDALPKRMRVAGAGTPRYMAPEQARGDAIDGRADLYALGASLFHAATGRPPFDATSANSLLYQHAAVAPPSIRTLAPALAVNLADAIDQCLAKLPNDRFTNAAAFVDAIKPLEGQRAIPASLVPAHEHMVSAKASLGWGAVVGATSVLLMLGEANHSFSRDIIFAIGASLGGFMAFVGVARMLEAYQAAGKALRSGTGSSDVERALAGDISALPVSASDRRKGWWRIGLGAAIALGQGHLSRIEGLPEILEALNQVILIFAPAYLVGRASVVVTRGTRLRLWLHERFERPLARSVARLARQWYSPNASPGVVAMPNAPTEVRLEHAVRAAMDRLPPEHQLLMQGANSAANALAEEARRLRDEDGVLLAQERLVRQDVTGDERAARLLTLKTERAVVQNRLMTAVAALETLRLDLLRLDAATPSKDGGLTTQLGAVRDLAHRVDAIAELRAYLAHSTPTPV